MTTASSLPVTQLLGQYWQYGARGEFTALADA